VVDVGLVEGEKDGSLDGGCRVVVVVDVGLVEGEKDGTAVCGGSSTVVDVGLADGATKVGTDDD